MSRVPINTVLQSVNRQGTKPSIGKLLAYAAALGVGLDALFGEGAVERLIAEASVAADEPLAAQAALPLDSAG